MHPDGNAPLPAQRASYTLLVRLWAEPRTARAPLWRGTVGDLRGNVVGAFSNPTELVQLIAKATGVTLLPPPN
jgi:hypothetical protein